jgi:hypothetical protein
MKAERGSRMTGKPADDAMTAFGSIGTAHDHLRERLIEIRDEVLDRMARLGAVEPGHLPLIAGINAVLYALDSIPIEVVAAARAVVSDDGREIRLTLYAQHGAVATLALDPCHAIALVGKLIEAALPRLKGRMTP